MRYAEIIREADERDRIDQEINASRTEYHEARDAKDERAAHYALQRFNKAVAALRDYDAAQDKLKPEPAVTPDTYKGEHEAPDHESGAPLYNLDGVYPADFYTGRAYQYGDNKTCLSIMLSLHNRPNAQLKVYRAIPKTVPRKINPGDWVTIDRRYAIEHGRDNLRNDYLIVSKTVFARDLFTDAGSVEEWGYDPQPRISRRPKPV